MQWGLSCSRRWLALAKLPGVAGNGHEPDMEEYYCFCANISEIHGTLRWCLSAQALLFISSPDHITSLTSTSLFLALRFDAFAASLSLQRHQETFSKHTQSFKKHKNSMKVS